MARDFKEIPKSVFLTRQAMKKFTDCLNKSGIFNQKIPYLVIHQKERYYGSELELKLTFKEDIKTICTSKDANERDKQLTMYILKKLNSVPNFKFDLANKVFIDYSASRSTTFEYDTVNKVYLRSQGTAKANYAHKDAVTKKQYTAKNIITLIPIQASRKQDTSC